MTKKYINIGSVKIDLDDYAIGGTALLGIRGSGKTYGAKGIAEQLLDHHVPIIVFDPIGRWHYLKTAGDDHKKKKGYKVVVAGGQYGDLPLTPDNAVEIIRAAIKENIPMVLDFYDRKMSKADWRKIVQRCFRTLLFENEGQRHIFLEETAEFAPQKIQDGETYAEVEKMVRMGGNVSLGITLINQRSQEVNKAVLDLCENLVLMKQRGSHAIGAIEHWMEKLSPETSEEIAKGLPYLGPGECWVFAGDAEKPVHTQTGPIHSFHPNRRKPELTARATAIRTTDTADFVKRLQLTLPKIVEEKKANDPVELKKRIAELERKTKTISVVDPAALTAATQKGFEAGWKECASMVTATLKLKKIINTKVTATPKVIPTKVTPKAAPTEVIESSIGKGGKRRIMMALAQYPEGMSIGKLSILTGLSSTSGTWSTYIGSLRTSGFIEGSDPLQITQSGLDALGSYEPLPTGQELVDYWRNRLGNSGKRNIFDALVEAYPKALSVEDVAAQTNLAPTSGTWSTYVGSLRTLGLIEGRKELKACEHLFQ